MPQFEVDGATGKGTIWLRKGAAINRTTVVGGNTVGWDSVNQVVNIVFPNPLATMNIASLPTNHKDDLDTIKSLMKHYANYEKKLAGA